jgi:hypothetical protein
MSETTLTETDRNAAIVKALRDVADLLEAFPHLRAPSTVVWGGLDLFRLGQSERFHALHDVADAFGLEVTEDARGDRTANGDFGPLTLAGYAYADSPAPAVTHPRVVQRPDGAR